MNQSKIKDFLFSKLQSGYDVSFEEFSKEDVERLQNIIISSGEDASSLEKVKSLFESMTGLIDVARITSFDTIWDAFWKIDKKVSELVHLHWYDPDTSYEEDIMTRYNCIKEYLEK